MAIESEQENQDRKKEMLDKNLELRQILMKAHAQRLLREKKLKSEKTQIPKKNK